MQSLFHLGGRYDKRNLEIMLDSCNFIFLINSHEYTFLLKEIIILYLFVVKEAYPQINDECKGCSFFRKHDVDFRQGASKAAILLVEKFMNVDTNNQICKVLYRNPSYIEQ